MNEIKFFLHQIKHTNDAYDKGIVIKDTLDAAKQSYHAYLGAYAYGGNAQTDFVSVFVSDTNGTILMGETWKAPVVESEE